MADLKAEAQKLDKALSALDAAVGSYFATAVELGRDAGDPTERGMDTVQLRRKIQLYIIARLGVRKGRNGRSLLQFDGSPEARRYVAVHGPLPGL